MNNPRNTPWYTSWKEFFMRGLDCWNIWDSCQISAKTTLLGLLRIVLGFMPLLKHQLP